MWGGARGEWLGGVRFDNSGWDANNPSMATATRSRSIASIDELLTYAVGQVTNAGEDCTFERLVYECFHLFPEQFRMQRYPEWPDSVRVNKTWLRCRTDRGWIIGSVQEGFRLTERGVHVASKVGRALGKTDTAMPQTGDAGKSRERYEAMLRHIRRQAAFQEYSADPATFTIAEPWLRVLLNGTLETPRRVLRQNLRAFQHAAVTYEDDEVAAFLGICDSILSERTSVSI